MWSADNLNEPELTEQMPSVIPSEKIRLKK
jgi:hypothetical protein